MTSRTTAAATPAASIAPEKSAFAHFNQRYSTALTAALGIITCVTGVMLFFHAYKGQITALHEWLGMGFVIATMLHLARHWKPFCSLMKQRRMHILTGLALLATVWFIAAAGTGSRENPMRTMGQTVNVMTKTSIATLAPVFSLSTDEAIARLADAGLREVDATQSADDIARTNNVTAIRVLGILGSNASSSHTNESASIQAGHDHPDH